VKGLPAVGRAKKAAVSIEMQFWMLSPVGPGNDGSVHWRNLANTTEPSVCGGDAALCQITMTTCYGRPA